MKQTAVQELISYFEQQKKQGCKNWCIEDLLAQLYQAKGIERMQKAEEYLKGFKDGKEYQIKLDELTFKSE